MSIFNNINGNDPFGALQGEGAVSADFPSGFQNSPFGPFWETAIYSENLITVEEPNEIIFQIYPHFDANKVRKDFNSQVVQDNVIRLYVIIKDTYPVHYGHQDDLREGNLRFSNIIEFVGVVLGNDIYRAINNSSDNQKKYVNTFAKALIENDSQLSVLIPILNEGFTHYMNNKRSDIFRLGLVGQLIQEEIKKDLQEFWKPVLNSLANEVRKLKIEDEKYWQPYHENGELKTEKEFTPIIGRDVRDLQEFALESIKHFDMIDSLILEYTGLQKIDSVTNFKSVNNKSLLKEALSEVYLFFKSILAKFKERLLTFIGTLAGKVYEANAFFVGLINGIVEAIAGLIDAVAMMAGLISGDAKQLKEELQKEFEKIQNEGFYDYLFNALSEFFKEVGDRYNTHQSKYEVMKKLGEDIIGIVEFILSLYYGYKIGVAILKKTKSLVNRLKKKVDDLFESSIDELDNISRHLDSVKLKKPELKDWIQALRRAGIRVRFIKESRTMIRYFRTRNVGASFDPFDIPPTIWLRGNPTDLELFHESLHFEDFLRRGRRDYIRGENRDDLPPNFRPQIPERDQLISAYIKEKYVLDKILEEQENWIRVYGKGRFTEGQIEFSKTYVEDEFANKLRKIGIDPETITIKK